MKFDLRVLRWVALFGLAVVLLQSLFASFPLKPRQGYGLVLWAFVFFAVVVVSLVLMPRAVGTLVRRPDLLVPLALLMFAEKLLSWLGLLPLLSALLNPSFPLRLLNLSFGISLHFLLNIALAVAYATWTTAAVLNLVRTDNSDPCAVMPSALRWFWRVLGLEFIGWGVVFLVTAAMLLTMPVVGGFALVPMLLFAVGWNFATAAMLPTALDSGPGFWDAFRAGVRVSLGHRRKWWLLLLAQMVLLGLVCFFYSHWSERGSQHTNMSWNVNAFWTGGYEHECRWYGKMAEAYHTSKLPFLETLLALLFGTMAVAIKVAIVQRLQPETSPDAQPPLEGTPPSLEPPVIPMNPTT